MRLYKKVLVKGQSFKGVKNVVIPSQSMSLKEIIIRFTRREALPIEKQGMYEDRMGDLEKISREDILERHERAAELKKSIQKAEKQKANAEAARKAKAEQDQKDKADLAAFRNAKSEGAEGVATLKNPAP